LQWWSVVYHITCGTEEEHRWCYLICCVTWTPLTWTDHPPFVVWNAMLYTINVSHKLLFMFILLSISFVYQITHRPNIIMVHHLVQAALRTYVRTSFLPPWLDRHVVCCCRALVDSMIIVHYLFYRIFMLVSYMSRVRPCQCYNEKSVVNTLHAHVQKQTWCRVVWRLSSSWLLPWYKLCVVKL